jgi:Cell Wall Hydrolase
MRFERGLPLLIILGAALTTAPVSAKGLDAVPPSQRAVNGLADGECLARTVYYEARGESPAGMVAVAAVTLNRAKDGRTACAVVGQMAGGHCQFSWVCHVNRLPHGDEWLRSQAVATVAAQAPDPTGGATYFSLCRVGRPSPSLVLTVRIGAHCFWAQPGDVAPRPLPSAYGLVEDSGSVLGYTLIVSGEALRSPRPGDYLEFNEPRRSHPDLVAYLLGTSESWETDR